MTTSLNEHNATSPTPEDPEGEGMTFWEHLDELRSRLVKMAVATCAGGAVAWYYRSKILGWLLQPFNDAWRKLGLPNEPQLNFPDPAGMFVAYLRMSLIAGAIFALPILFYQVWAFVAPGLYSREKRFAIPFVVASSGLFAGGAYFGMKFAFPVAFHYLLSFAGKEADFTINPNIMVGDYVQFITQMLLVFGGMFELPVLAFFLTVAGIIDHTHLIKFFRYFVVLAFVLGAILTPPDLLSQFLMAVPLVLLYTLSIGIAYLFSKTRAKAPKP
jgi:sec-independent protein translocase protein TatC